MRPSENAMMMMRPTDLVNSDVTVDKSDQRGNERALRFQIAMTPTPINLRVKGNESVFVEVARHGGGIELPPRMRVDEWRGEME